ncbi:MAG: hypothetical protein SFX73_38480 [Kofleriaceae bacterium]|nr:hypothetical protein [Kofleriaceae bacterium]
MQSAQAPTRLDLPFAAPVPRGNVVVFVRIEHPEDDRVGTALIDSTSGVVYCEESWFGLFVFPTAASEPARVARDRGWSVVEQVVGRVVGATLATSKTPREAAVRTAVFVDTSDASPYR